MIHRIKTKWPGIKRTLRSDWDRLTVGLLMLAFGFYSLINPVLSVRSAIPWTVVELLFNFEFIVAGLALVGGLFVDKPFLYRLGCVVSGIGLLTVGGIIMVLTKERGTALAILLIAFAAMWPVAFRRHRPPARPVSEEELTAVVQAVLRAEEQRAYSEVEGYAQEAVQEAVRAEAEEDDDA